MGISILVKLVQPQNADSILVTLLGMLMLVKPVQPENELLGMLVPPLITTVFRDDGTLELPPNMEVNVWLVVGNVILINSLQFLNASAPMLVTLSGMVMLVKLVFPLNALSIMVLLPDFVMTTVFRVVGINVVCDVAEVAPNN